MSSKPALPKSLRAWIAAAAAAVLVVSLIAFFLVTRVVPPLNTGPLGNGGSEGGICVPLAQGEPLSWGVTYLGNSGGSDAVIEKVDLVNAKDARLVATYVVPIKGLNEYGGLAGYPAGQHLESGVDWAARQGVPGGTVTPVHGHDHADLVTVILPTGPVAEAQAIDVFYREDGTNYHMQTHYRFVLLVGQKQCSDNWSQKYPG